jgi:hypothetical protein
MMDPRQELPTKTVLALELTELELRAACEGSGALIVYRLEMVGVLLRSCYLSVSTRLFHQDNNTYWNFNQLNLRSTLF